MIKNDLSYSTSALGVNMISSGSKSFPHIVINVGMNVRIMEPDNPEQSTSRDAAPA